MNKISAIVIIYNDDKVLERCLQSLFGVVDEIVVIHDGPCRDQSIEIARKYTDQVIETERWAGYCEAHYVKALSMCHGDWVLKFDADEFLSDELKNNLRKLVSVNNVDGWSFVWPIWNGRKYLTSNWPYKQFLFRYKKISYLTQLHSTFNVGCRVAKSKLIVHHQPLYNNYSLAYSKDKLVSWSKKHANDLMRPIEQLASWNIEDLSTFLRRRRLKLFLLHNWFFVFCFSIFSILQTINFRIDLFIQKGFWLFSWTNIRYNLYLSKEIANLRRSK